MQTTKNVISSPAVSESYYKIQHKSGLTILLHPMEKYNSVYALFGTKFGSVNRTFKTDSDEDYCTVPDGIAHFLEHKLFEGETEDAFVSYSRTGANANAYTSFDRTCYLFSATEKIYESLEILLNFVTHPYFTKETVEKEQGIIGQEIKMYDDDPSWCVFLNLLKALYWENPIRIDIAGSAQSIAEITPELLYRTYNTFYNLNNMVLSIAGNFEVDKVLELCDKLLPEAKDIKIENKLPSEPSDVFLKKIEKKLEVSMPTFEIGFKEKPQKDNMRARILSEMLLEIIFGESTQFYQSLYSKGVINSTFGTEVMSGDGYFVNILGGEAPDPELVYDEIVAEIERVKAEGLSRELFENIKKQFYGGRVSSFNTVENVASSALGAYFEGHDAFDALDIISSITFEELCEHFKGQFNEKYSSISVINPM